MKSDDFYHADCPLLFGEHDTVTSLQDCPFPLVTDSFKVILFGTSKSFPNDKPEHGHTKRFAIVEYKKSCGHTVQERISFAEGVKTFDHYGTTFEGASYSIQDWQRRIEFFRTNLPCDVCQMVKHALWIWEIGEGGNSKKKAKSRLLSLLDYNFGNWQEFVNPAEIDEAFAKVKRAATC